MVDSAKLKAEQEKLASKVSISDFVKSFKKVETIAGIAVTFDKNTIFVSIVVCSTKNFSVIEEKSVVQDVIIPYIPGYLFYREGPAIISAFNELDQKPDLLLVQGNGILHERRIGMASHLGVLLDIPSIGVAQKHSLGEKVERTIYIDKEALAYEVLTKEHARPLIVSPGNKVSLKLSSEIVKESIVEPHKLPEPLHIAQKVLRKFKKKELEK